MDRFEFTSEKEDARMRAYRISSREELFHFVKAPDTFLITPQPLRQSFRETKHYRRRKRWLA